MLIPPLPTDSFGSLSASKSLLNGLPNNNLAGVSRVVDCVYNKSDN